MQQKLAWQNNLIGLNQFKDCHFIMMIFNMSSVFLYALFGLLITKV